MAGSCSRPRTFVPAEASEPRLTTLPCLSGGVRGPAARPRGPRTDAPDQLSRTRRPRRIWSSNHQGTIRRGRTPERALSRPFRAWPGEGPVSRGDDSAPNSPPMVIWPNSGLRGPARGPSPPPKRPGIVGRYWLAHSTRNGADSRPIRAWACGCPSAGGLGTAPNNPPMFTWRSSWPRRPGHARHVRGSHPPRFRRPG